MLTIVFSEIVNPSVINIFKYHNNHHQYNMCICTGKYELFIRGGKMISEGDYSEENRFADFSFWVSDNSVKCDTKFHQIDNVSIEIMWLLSLMLRLIFDDIDGSIWYCGIYLFTTM